MKISLELVPRSEESLLHQLESTQSHGGRIARINLPDVTRLKLRSWEAARIVSTQSKLPVIPHLRAMDFDLSNPENLESILNEPYIHEIIVVSGDPISELTRMTYPTTAIDLIRYIKIRHPKIRIYGALDPYRTGFRQELIYARQKQDVGCDGFFTQPFFDLRQAGMVADQFSGQDVFMGISPVIADTSRAYWERTNHVVFPTNFHPDLDWNVTLYHEMYALCTQADLNMYLMPIKIKMAEYLEAIFSKPIV